MERAHSTKQILTTYLRRLTNLSGNNRSLFLPRLGSDQFLDIHELSQLNKEKSFTIIEALIAAKKKHLCAVADSRMEAVNESSKKLKKLQRLDQFLFDERGSRDLHVGWPFVRGKFADGTWVRCPLLFFPVELVVENNSWVIRPREDADITFNKSFLLAHSFYNKLKPDEALLEETFEDADSDSTVFRTYIYQLLQKGTIDIQFNPDNYRDELTSFLNFRKEDFDTAHFNGQLKLFPEAVLGIFPQSGSYLIPDYTLLIDNDKIPDLEEFFAARTGAVNEQRNFLQEVKEEKMYPAFSMDAWQENALKAVKTGHSVVVQGPPGTGKSQLICNLIADGLAHGKRILVVCQKRAALDVVYERLVQKKMNDFLALVHDFKNDRKTIFQKASQQIDHIDEYKAKNNSIDTIQIERKFFQTSRRIDQITEELDEFKKTLFDDSECGFSAKELYLLSHSDQPTINVKQEYNLFTRAGMENFVTKLDRYARYAKRFKAPDYLWLDRKVFSNWSVKDLKACEKVLSEIGPYFKSLLGDLQQVLSAQPDWSDCEAFWANRTRATEMLQLLAHFTTYRFFVQMFPYDDEETSSLWLANQARMISDCFKKEGVERSIRSRDLGSFQSTLQKARRAQNNFFRRIQWELTSKDKNLVKRTLIANGLKYSKEGTRILEQKLDNRLNLEHNLSRLRTKKWLHDIPDGYSSEEFEIWFDHHQKAIRAKLIFNYIRGFKNFIDPQFLDVNDFHSKLENLYKPLYYLQQRKEEWKEYLTDSQIERITKDDTLAERLGKVLREDFDALNDFDKMEESFSTEERSVVERVVDFDPQWDHQSVCDLFLNSIYTAWLDHLETKFPILRIPSSDRLFSLERELRSLIEEKEKISNEILLLRARENVIDNMEFNRLNNRVTYRDLHHQLNKKKKIWPVRKVISEFEDEIFRLLPCWLTSPESASAMFPMKEMFDLVIFDEASQCFAEQGIPSLFRARQVLIAGDSQQLRPNDLYMARWREEDTDHPDLEVDSLLELSGRYLMSMTLQGHYRSKALELIEFSNHHFYRDKLQLLPDRDVFNALTPAIDYVKTDGIWENQVNRVEAEKIAGLALEHYQTQPEKEIGIITFNAPQQMLVLDMLEEKFASANTPVPSSLFVKNIENVQGDEKDVIIFSIGYAYDKKKKLNAQFGSLNQAGGENRLNVAITRAREKIIVVASIFAEDLHTEESKNQGPRLLKEYLSYARRIANGQRYTYDKIKPTFKSAYFTSLKSVIQDRLPEKIESIIEDETVPFADLVVKRKSRYTGLIQTDDNLYSQSLSAKAWHAQTPHLFDLKKWKYTMTYSRNFWMDPEKFLNDVSRSVN